MIRSIKFLVLIAALVLSSCAKKDSSEEPKTAAEATSPAATAPAAAPAAAEPAEGPHAFVLLKDGSKVPGKIVASSQTDMVVAGDDGIERKIPLAQIKSVQYGDAEPSSTERRASREPAPRQLAPREPAQSVKGRGESVPAQQPAPPQTPADAQRAAPPAAAVTTTTYELPAGSEISVRVNEDIDSATAREGQTFDADVTRSAKDANGDVVIPGRSKARVVIKSASKGGHFRGASDLVLDLQSVTINGRQYALETTDVGQKGKSGVGANKRTATYTGGGAALGAIIGAIAGGGKGAAIGAGAGAGAGVLTQVLTKGGAIKVPAESVLTFSLDKPLKVTASD